MPTGLTWGDTVSVVDQAPPAGELRAVSLCPQRGHAQATVEFVDGTSADIAPELRKKIAVE